MIRVKRVPHCSTVLCLALGGAMGLVAREWAGPSQAHDAPAPAQKSPPKLAPDTAAAYAPDWDRPYPQYQPVGKVLQPCPSLKPGEIPPQDLSIFGGAGKTSYASVDDV